MKNKWYKSKVTKNALVIAEHIFTILIILSVFSMMVCPSLTEEIVEGRNRCTYEDSLFFEECFQNYSRRAVEGTHLQELLETDGEYDSNKIIDIEEYWDTNVVSGENKSGLAFRLEELLQWDVDSGGFETENEQIIVCETKEGTYQYYNYAQFVSLIKEGEFRLNGYLGEEDLFSYLDEMATTRENFLQIQNKEGEVLFVNCWKYDGSYFQNQYKTVDGISIVELVNTNEHWNGRLQEAFDMIRNCVYNLRESESAYWESVNNLEEGDTNFAFVYVDKDTKKVYSNKAGFTDYKKINNYMTTLKGYGKYVVVTPEVSGFESNMQETDAGAWRSAIKYAGNYDTDFLFVAGIDTEFAVYDDFHTEKQFYDGYSSLIKTLMVIGAIMVIPWITGLIWLTMIAGKNPYNEEIVLNRFDKWKTELAAIVTGSCAIASAVAGCVLFLDRFLSTVPASGLYNYGGEELFFVLASAGLLIAAFAFFLTGYLSLVRRIKAGTLWKNSLLRILAGLVKHVFYHVGDLWKTLLVFAGYMTFQMMLLFLITDGGISTVIGFSIWILVNILIGVYFVIYVIGREKIADGIKRIAEGDVEYKVSTQKMLPEHKRLAETVNAIGEGLDAAVEKSMKSERLKTDLITNVSHDIKTPLTSIINYVDLLKKENFQDPKIQHYIEVLEQKAQRLKILTEDVVEASKVSSGNVTLEYMNINFVEMIQQTSGEFEEKFKKRGLQEILKLPDEEVVIHVDGRRTWRILENIYNNAAKYAMEGSRVYANLKVAGGKAIFELKNISEQPLNISADELTERFIRGDISRSTEGSGLGLSIARSLTELQGGTFELYLDGDLFKVTIMFDIVDSVENVDK